MQFGTWTPIGAVQVDGGGYDVAWKNTGTDQYTVWSTDSNGNYLSNIIGVGIGQQYWRWKRWRPPSIRT